MLKKHPFYLIILSVFFICNRLSAQNTNSIIEKCNIEIAKNNYKAAYSIIKDYAISQPENFEAQRIAANLAYWTWDIPAAKLFFKNALSFSDKNLNTVKRDYAKMLVDLGKYNQATSLLKEYIQINQSSQDDYLYYIKALYYNGNISKALNEINNMPELVKKSDEIIVLQKEIEISKSYTINLGFNISKDDQPLSSYSPELAISKNHSSLLNWGIKGNFHQFSSQINTSAYIIQASNQFLLFNNNTRAIVHLGLSNLTNQSSSTFIGGIGIKQSLLKHLDIQFDAERKPYFYSLYSTNFPIFHNSYGAALSINNYMRITGKIQAEQQDFNDHNQLKNYSAWFYYTALRNSILDFNVGLSYQYADAKINHFQPIASTNSYLNTTKINGEYIPYFTPKNQSIFSSLLLLNLKLSKEFNFSASSTIPLHATIDNPYFFLNSGTGNGNNLFFDKGYAQQKYSPFNFKSELTFLPKQRLKTSLGYEYLKNYYFKNHYLRFSISINGI